MNSLVSGHLVTTHFSEYQLLRSEVVAVLTDADLEFRPAPSALTLGELCREIGDIEYSYIESLRSFTQDFGWHGSDPAVQYSIDRLAAWFVDLDTRLMSAIEALSEEDIATKRIARKDYDVESFAPLPAQQLDIYREALLIFYGKVSIYLRLMGKALPVHWAAWIG